MNKHEEEEWTNPIPLPDSADPVAMMDEVMTAVQDAMGMVINADDVQNITIRQAPINQSRIKQLYKTSEIAKGMIELMSQKVEDPDNFKKMLGLK